jgi:PH domain
LACTIIRAADELFSHTASELASTERVESLGAKELTERLFCTETKSLSQRVETLRQASKQRAKIRRDVMKLLTTAAEELDSLPEELTLGLNKMLHTIDEADHKIASLVAMKSENMAAMNASATTLDNSTNNVRWTERPSMPPHPIDAQRAAISLKSLRQKLGEISHTTLLRIRNLSGEPLRLKSGVQLKEGKYIKSLNTTDPKGSTVCHYLYPGTEIPPWTEVAVAARNKGSWVPTSGISGKIVYTNRDETWSFRISFSNELITGVRKCQVEASYLDKRGDNSTVGEGGNDGYWQITKEEIDRKANCEVVITIELLNGEDAARVETEHQVLKSGMLLKNKAFGLRLQWYKRYFELTATHLKWSMTAAVGKMTHGISISDIHRIQKGKDMVHSHVFEIHTADDDEPLRFSAPTANECHDWIRSIANITGLSLLDSTEDSDHSSSSLREGVECVESPTGTEFHPV